ncbi:uncharacterized protein SCODWIG_03717 [Saccharomycodes ludwigii]|uniref:Nitrogen regulatory protein areA GATA-like domain-containing protein n=1 Tax=Saccharomycodes ludwigii TaxID=36035 RepID=A0A376BBG2_9ASCO|nr:uncharacterized protein SCODWIG_03717 [Saccharomycodes ludwigii]
MNYPYFNFQQSQPQSNLNTFQNNNTPTVITNDNNFKLPNPTTGTTTNINASKPYSNSLARLKLQNAIEDPSSEALWKMYSKAKASLPYKERMSNLTWRMLGMRIKEFKLKPLKSNSNNDDISVSNPSLFNNNNDNNNNNNKDRKSTRLNSSHTVVSRMPSSA